MKKILKLILKLLYVNIKHQCCEEIVRTMLVKELYPWEQFIMMSQQLVLVLLNKEIVTILVYQVDAILMWIQAVSISIILYGC